MVAMAKPADRAKCPGFAELIDACNGRALAMIVHPSPQATDAP